MTDLAEWLRSALSSGNVLAAPLALIGGLVMGLNPCCLALYPAAAATCCTGACDEPQRRMPLSRAALFVLGTAMATMVLGVIAAWAGQVMGGLSPWVRYVVAVVPLLMGAHALGLVRLPAPKFISAQRRGTGLVGAFVSGLLLSLVISPCGTPVLAAILSYAAFQGSVAYGGVLLFAYGLGSGIPLLVVGIAAGGLVSRLSNATWLRWIERVAGGVLVALGFYLIWSA